MSCILSSVLHFQLDLNTHEWSKLAKCNRCQIKTDFFAMMLCINFVCSNSSDMKAINATIVLESLLKLIKRSNFDKSNKKNELFVEQWCIIGDLLQFLQSIGFKNDELFWHFACIVYLFFDIGAPTRSKIDNDRHIFDALTLILLSVSNLDKNLNKKLFGDTFSIDNWKLFEVTNILVSFADCSLMKEHEKLKFCSTYFSNDEASFKVHKLWTIIATKRSRYDRYPKIMIDNMNQRSTIRVKLLNVVEWCTCLVSIVRLVRFVVHAVLVLLCVVCCLLFFISHLSFVCCTLLRTLVFVHAVIMQIIKLPSIQDYQQY